MTHLSVFCNARPDDAQEVINQSTACAKGMFIYLWERILYVCKCKERAWRCHWKFKYIYHRHSQCDTFCVALLWYSTTCRDRWEPWEGVCSKGKQWKTVVKNNKRNSPPGFRDGQSQWFTVVKTCCFSYDRYALWSFIHLLFVPLLLCQGHWGTGRLIPPDICWEVGRSIRMNCVW